MAKSKVKQIADVARPVLTSKNHFNEANAYGPSDTISPNGRDPDAAGNIGTAIDIVQRNNLTSKNIYNINNQYSVED